MSEFQIEIIKGINNKNIGKNIMVSPLSIYHILSLTSNGASNKTLSEMIQALGHKDLSELNKNKYINIFFHIKTKNNRNGQCYIYKI